MGRYRLLLLVVALLLPIQLVAAEDASVTGAMIVNGKTIKLTHVYAIAIRTESPNDKLYRLIVSDAAISDKDLALFPDVLIKTINDGALHAIRANLDEHGAVDSVEIYMPSETTWVKEGNKSELKTFNEKTIAGRVHLDKYDDGSGTYAYDLKFSAPIRQEADLTAEQ